MAFWINYSVNLHFKGKLMYILPLAVQAIPAVLLFLSMLLCQESPRWLARKDRWGRPRPSCRGFETSPLTPISRRSSRKLLTSSEHERNLIGDATFWGLQKEMWTIPGNRKRVLISITLMICQQ